MSDRNPTPWSLRPCDFDDWGAVRDANGVIVALARELYLDNDLAAACRRNGTDPYEEIGRAIVALPDLLAACEALTNAVTYRDLADAKARPARPGA